MRTRVQRTGAVGSISVLSLTALLLLAMPAEAAVWHVNAASTAATPDGQTWATAYPAIQPAVDATASGDEVWVAAGTYTGTGAQVVNLKADITLYAGFAGTETAHDQRDCTANTTVIDGQHSRRSVTAADGTSTADGFRLQNGNAHEGGGMYNGTATQCTFAGNAATETLNGGYGGGGMCRGTAINCTFTENTAVQDGGGMHDGKAINCAFAQNSAGAYGGGVYACTVVNCTFTGNSADDSGGGMCGGMAVNCIVWCNAPDAVYGTTVSYSCLSAATIGAGNIVGDPGFVNPWALDLRLRAGSPCIDVGTVDGAPATDLLDRARTQGTGADMGAYEYYPGDDAGAVNTPPVLRVSATSTAANPDGLTWSTAFPTLQAAADRSGYGGEIWVTEGTYTVGAGIQVVRLLPGTDMFGGFTGTETARDLRHVTAHLTVIDGQRERRCMTGNSLASVDGFTLQNGNAYMGGGMYHGTATNCTFTGDVATYGGGIFEGTATNCRFIRNAGENRPICGYDEDTGDWCGYEGSLGGGMYGGKATNCTFTTNFSGAYGGGMYNGTAINCTFTGNSAANNGGGMGFGKAANCIIWNNAPDVIYWTSVSYCCVSAATAGTGNIVADPLFANAAAGDYRLQAGSPCIDTGTADGAPTADILGVPRPQGGGVDMGAYEVAVSVSVPDLSQLARAAVRVKVAAAQLYVRYETEEYHPSIPADHVIRQNPLTGTQVIQRTPVDLVISKGPEPVPVPDVTGKPLGTAAATIISADLLVGTVTQQWSTTVPTDAVIDQTPAAGTQALPDSPVNLVVSRGVQPSIMPDVVGMPWTGAEACVTGAGLQLGQLTRDYSDAFAAGRVMAQSPAADTELPPGTVVSIVASLGPAPVPEGGGEPIDHHTAWERLASGFATADKNRDGMLSFDEAVAALPELTLAIFSELDTNGDGQLSADELGVDSGNGCKGCQGGKSHFLTMDWMKRLDELLH